MEKKQITFSIEPGMVNWFWVGQKYYYFAFGFSKGSIVITKINYKTGLPYDYPAVALISPVCCSFIKNKGGKNGGYSQTYLNSPIKWLSGNEETHILASLSGVDIKLYSLNNGMPLNTISLSNDCKLLYGLHMSKYNFVICGKTSLNLKQGSFFIQLISTNGKVQDCFFSTSPIRGFKLSDREINIAYKETSDVDAYFKRTMEDKVFYFTKSNWYIYSWIDQNDFRKLSQNGNIKIKLRNFCPWSYKIIGETIDEKTGQREYRICEPKSEFTEKWLKNDVIL